MSFSCLKFFSTKTINKTDSFLSGKRKNYINFTKPINEKIIFEKRRRYQIYTLMDYFLSKITYFDFFSQDVFDGLIMSKYLANQEKKNSVTTEFVLLSLLKIDLELADILMDYQFQLTEEEIKDVMANPNKNRRAPYYYYFNPLDLLYVNEIRAIFSFILSYTKQISPDIFFLELSKEVNTILEKAVENALIRFKTPVVTSDILLITMMEDNKNEAGKIIKKIIFEELNWYLLRYKLIKRLHNEEVNIRNEVKKNQRYFAYLLKSHLSQFEFFTLLDTETLPLGVSLFRNLLISQLMSANFNSVLENEIRTSIDLTNKRKYFS
jgi:hypothetical protein